MKNYNIHNGSKNSEEKLSCETGRHDEGEKIWKIISKIVVESMDIGWNDRRIAEGLFYTTMKTHFEGRNGILEQYLHTQLDIIAQTLKEEFGVDAEVNYDFATHAKFRDIISAIKKLKPKTTE